MLNQNLASLVLKKLSSNERKFLLSVKMGSLNFSLLSISGLEDFPAIRWEIENTAVEKLKTILY